MSNSSLSGTRKKSGVGTIAFLLVAVVCGTLLNPATATAARPSQQTIDAAPSPVLWWTPITFTGKLTGKSGNPLKGQQVNLEWRGLPDGGWQFSNSGVTEENGAVAIPATITTSAEWRINFPGARTYDAAISPAITVESQPPPPPVNQQIVDMAAAQAGKGYTYGASGPDSFDCSGFTQYVHGQLGIGLPRTTGEQRAATRGIGYGDMLPGDLVFFGDPGNPYHVGIFAGGNQIWAAPDAGDVVKLQNIWTDAYTVGRAW